MARRFRVLFAVPTLDAEDVIDVLRDSVLRRLERACAERGIIFEYAPFTRTTAGTLLEAPAVVVCIVGLSVPDRDSPTAHIMPRTLGFIESDDAREQRFDEARRLLKTNGDHAEHVRIFLVDGSADAGSKRKQASRAKAPTPAHTQAECLADACPDDHHTLHRIPEHEFGRHIAEVLLAMVESRFPEITANSVAAEIRSRHATFAEDLRSRYVRVRSNADDLCERLATSETPIVVTGPSGTGKTTLVVNEVDRYAVEELVVIRHFVENDGDTPDHGPLLQHVLSSLELAGLRSGTNNVALDALETELVSWANEVVERPVLLVLDGLDRLHPSSRRLHWLPRRWAPGIRLVVVAADGDAADALTGRGWNRLHLSELAPEIAMAGITPRRKSGGSATHGSAAPDDDELSRLVGMALNGSAEAIDHLLDRPLTHEAWRLLRLLAASHQGLTIEELHGLFRVTAPSARITKLLETLRAFAVRRGDLVTFTSRITRDRVMQRIARTPGTLKRARATLAHYLLRNGTPMRRAEELPALLRALGNHDDLQAMLADLDVVMAMIDSGRASELLRLWNGFGGQPEMRGAYRNSINIMYARSPTTAANVSDRIAVVERLAAFLSECGAYESAGTLLEQAERHREVFAPDDLLTRIRLLAAHGEICRRAGHLDAAKKLLQDALALTVGIDEFGRLRAQIESDLALVLSDAGDPGALEHFKRAYAAKLDQFGRGHPSTAETLSDMGLAHLNRGSFRTAARMFQHALDVQRAQNTWHWAASTYLNNLAGAQKFKGRTTMAVGLYLEAWLERIHLLHPRHHLTLFTQFNAAAAIHAREMLRKSRTGNQGTEESLYGDDPLELALSAHRDLYAVIHHEHPDLLKVSASLGEMLRQRGRRREAEPILRNALGACRRVFDQTHRTTATCAQNLGLLLHELGEHAEAVDHCTDALAAWRAMLPANTPPIALALRVLAGPTAANGQPWLALMQLLEALTMQTDAAGENKPQTAITRQRIVEHMQRAFARYGIGFIPDGAEHKDGLYLIIVNVCACVDEDVHEGREMLCALTKLYLARFGKRRNRQWHVIRKLRARLGCEQSRPNHPPGAGTPGG